MWKVPQGRKKLYQQLLRKLSSFTENQKYIKKVPNKTRNCVFRSRNSTTIKNWKKLFPKNGWAEIFSKLFFFRQVKWCRKTTMGIPCSSKMAYLFNFGMFILRVTGRFWLKKREKMHSAKNSKRSFHYLWKNYENFRLVQESNPLTCRVAHLPCRENRVNP